MANRRFGGMGGLQRSNRSAPQHQPFQGSNVNPWQGGAPSNNINQGLISQIANNPQQLALALTSLLQPQQQMNNPPSLLSLNTAPALSNQDRDGNRYGRGRDFRRHEPYNKNRNAPTGGGWRQMDGGRNRRNPPKEPKRPFKDSKREQQRKPRQEERHQEVKIKEEDEQEETKREWKAEKNTEEEKPKTKEDSKNHEGRYFDVPQKLLICFVCNKEMWDGESMQKHIKGSAHRQMIISLEESIHSTVDILRENIRLAEEKKVIELNRVYRLKKQNNRFQESESHCNMCNLKFIGKIIAHRKTEGHQRLKRYLHPSCEVCNKEFSSRIEWIEHRLTPEHMRLLNKSLSSKVGGPDGQIIVKEGEPDIELILEEATQLESDNPILELDQELVMQNLPAYKKDRPISMKSLKPFTGFMCELCNRSFANEELAQKHMRSVRHYYEFIGTVKAMCKKGDEKKIKTEKEDEEEMHDDQNEEPEDMYDPEEATVEEEERDESHENDGGPFLEDHVVKEEREDEEQEKVQEPAQAVATRSTRRGGRIVGPRAKRGRK